MKKILLGTTAVIALGTLSTEAFAADKIKLELGGFMRQYVGFSNSDEVATVSTNDVVNRDTGLGQQGNSEVYFTGSTTLDNGLKVAATMQLEANAVGTRNMDESYVTVSSDAMGAVSLGARPHAAAALDVRAPNAGNHDWNDVNDWIAGSRAATASATAATIGLQANDMDGNWTDDTIKAVYISPSFAGVTVGASWSAAEGSGAGESGQLITSNLRDGYSFGVAYAGDFDGVTVDASIVHGRTSALYDQTGLGLSVGVAGFTVGGAYYDFDGKPTSGVNTDSADGKGYEIGVAYATGPYSLSATYMNSEDKGTTATAGDDEDTMWQLSATYDLGAGVALTATYFDVESDPEGDVAGTSNGLDGNGLITGIEVGF
ncbi:porin [Magnetovibrio sp. PR-2]|uniref:porin n=1 Tax=Magnetovibrio sp. PR-2 TaxID=3120356 RepID=UPI002FCE44FC